MVPDGSEFEFETETLAFDAEVDNGERIPGTGRLGCVAAMSLLAPVAVVRFADIEHFEDSSCTYPDIQPSIYSLDGEPLDRMAYIRDYFGETVAADLLKLRDKLIAALESLSLTVLPEEELAKTVPWLLAGDDVFIARNDSAESCL